MTCKPDSHPTLYEEVELLSRIDGLSGFTQGRWTGRYTEVWQGRYTHQLPLRDSLDTLRVSWCEVTIYREDTGERIYHNAFATSHTLSEKTVIPVITAGRTRWKVENENNNVLKNYGYHLEHNYGHGQQYLAAILVMLNLLAFLIHTSLDLTDLSAHSPGTGHPPDLLSGHPGPHPIPLLRQLGCPPLLHGTATRNRPAAAWVNPY